ncbi:MAG: hypothetical protein H6729_10635 [Deltaproteobacteria bacterium]|nr:hypothetical protein [Deltaproteobacteria bacterium]
MPQTSQAHASVTEGSPPFPAELQEFLGPRAASVVANIADPALRERNIEALNTCRSALHVVDGLDLLKYELAQLGPPEPTVWYELIPEIERIVMETWRAAQRLVAAFPAKNATLAPVDPDVDSAFDAMVQEGPPAPIRDDRESEIERVVSGRHEAANTDVGGSIAALAAMLRSDFVTFQHRIGQFTPESDRWWLLGDVQEFRSRCAQCLEAATATILKALSKEDLERLLPRYADATTRAIRLRTAFTDLHVYVHNAASWLSFGGDTRALEVALGLKREIETFTRLPAYAYVRAADKRGIIQFRIAIDEWENQDGDAQALKTIVEGFLRLTDLFRGINHRPALVSSDRRYLRAIELTLRLGLTVTDVLHFLERAYGRSDDLDDVIRACKLGNPPPPERVAALAKAALEHLPGPATMS